MKTTFEKELRKIFGQDLLLDNTKFVGRSCYGRLDGDLRVRADFISTHIHDHYDALKISIIDRKEGVIDASVLRFDELWGVKQTTNPNFRDGVHPHLWKDGHDLYWYVYHPTPADFEKLSDAVNGYLEVFRDMEQDQGMTQTM